MMKTKAHVVVVVWYNPTSEVSDNIDSYIDYVDTVYCIDNSSNDNSCLYKHEKFRYLPQYRNIGLSKALRLGCEEAIKDGALLLTTMDQDSIFDSETFTKLDTYFNELGRRNLVAPTLKYIFRDTHTGKREFTESIVDCSFSEQWVITSGSTFSAEMYQSIGGFDEYLFIGQIDQDFCFRLKQKGYNITQLTDCFLYQELGNTVSRRLGVKKFLIPNLSPIRYYYIFRNERYLREKWGIDYMFYYTNLYKYLFSIVFFEKKKINKLISCWKGYRDGKKS